MARGGFSGCPNPEAAQNTPLSHHSGAGPITPPPNTQTPFIFPPKSPPVACISLMWNHSPASRPACTPSISRAAQAAWGSNRRHSGGRP